MSDRFDNLLNCTSLYMASNPAPFKINNLLARPRHRSARRALIELGRTDRTSNAKLLEMEFNKEAEYCRNKWNFDPDTGPIKTVPQKFEWEKRPSLVDEKNEEQKEMTKLILSLPNNRNQPQQQTLSIVSAKLTQEKDKISTNDKNSTPTQVNVVESTEDKAKEEKSISTKEVQITEEPTVLDCSSSKSITIPTVTANIKTIQNSINSSQTKITDFTVHRKRPHNCVDKEDSSIADSTTITPPQSKRAKI